MKRIKTFAGVLMLHFISACSGNILLTDPKCTIDGRDTEITEAELRFGWKVSSSDGDAMQSACEIEVAQTPDDLLHGDGLLWDTGKAMSSESVLTTYGGKPLENGRDYWWRARIWDRNGRVSDWCQPQRFITASGLHDTGAQWIGAITKEEARLPEGNDYHTWGLSPQKQALWADVAPGAGRSIMLRKEFTAGKEIEHATMLICGLGHYRLFVNGTEIAPESAFKPLWSEYGKTVYYDTHDVTSAMKEGGNAIGVILGNGMYNVVGGRYVKFRHSYGPPVLIACLDIQYADGTYESVTSDTSWKFSESPVTFNCIFGGEDYDARLEQPGWDRCGFDDSLWREAVVSDGPDGTLTPQKAPHIHVSEMFDVQNSWSPSPGKVIFDMGQNHSGYPVIKVSGQRGQKIRLIPAERIEKDSSAVIQSTSGSPYSFEYTLKGDGEEEWSPSFAFYGYRYLQAESLSEATRTAADCGGIPPQILSLRSCFVHSSAARTGSFECSNDLFNRIHSIIDKAARSNMHAVFTDCPHREKLGWLEETHLNGPGLLFNYDLRGLMPKIMKDIEDTQHADGLIPDIAPEYVAFQDGCADSPEWGCAGAILPWMYYEWYGDDSLIRKHYMVMRRYADYLSARAEGHILEYGLGDWCDYGPAPAGYSQNTPAGITATAHYLMVVRCTAEAARLTGRTDDATKYSALAAKITEAFNGRFFDPATDIYGNGSQCCQALPIFLDIVPDGHEEQVLDNLVKSVEEKGWKLSTGDIGNRYLFQALARNGRNDVMYRMHNHHDLPGYGYQVKMGVTTLTEQWNPELGLSWNHFMMGQIEEWFYSSLGGISPDPSAPGFSRFFIRPAAPEGLEWVKCSYESIRGLIRSEWRIEDGVFFLEIEVPGNTVAAVTLPFGDGKSIEAGPGIHRFSCPAAY